MIDRLGVDWRIENGEVRGYKNGSQVAFAPQPGAQYSFLTCGSFECLAEGNRGGGKTTILLVDFAQHTGHGFGREWRGILFRHTYKQLEDVVNKSLTIFPRVFPQATFNRSQMRWDWPDGETLFFRYFERRSDYDEYHGHAYPWIGWEELTTWPTPHCYLSMFSCCRSTKVGAHDKNGVYRRMPRKVRATTNPYGVGHNWVKDRFKLPVKMGATIYVVDNKEDRSVVHIPLAENQSLLIADPDYQSRIVQAANSPEQVKAWVEGNWDIVAGGMFDDLWKPKIHVLPDIDPVLIPQEWRINRAYDHGQSRPFSVGWWAESSGEPIIVSGRKIGPVRGDLIRIAEWYGSNGQPNEGLRMSARDIAEHILQQEEEMGLEGRVKRGPADSAIFDDFQPGTSIAGEMKAKGVTWEPANKGPGSRRQGWAMMRSYLKAAAEPVREAPGLFVCASCDAFLRTVPVLSRDEKDPDDIDTDAEDHVADETRYRLRQQIPFSKARSF